MTPDDSALLHGGVYDPAKAREYYLRTRKLKGRQGGGGDGGPKGRPQGSPAGKPGGPSGEARRKEIAAQQAALEKRLERLKEVLANLVEDAKGRSGAVTKEEKAKETAAKNESKKKGEKLTAKEKREAAKRSQEYRDKQPPAKELAALQAQVKDIRGQIAAAIADSRKKSSKSKTAPNGR